MLLLDRWLGLADRISRYAIWFGGTLVLISAFVVSVDVLLGRQPDVGPIDVVVCITDASNLERNLYLLSQVLDLELPTVLVLNMWDAAQRIGLQIDVEELRKTARVMALAGGESKTQAIAGALKLGVIDVLVTDKFTAARLTA